MMLVGLIDSVTGNAGMQIDFPDNINPNIADNSAVTGQKADGSRPGADGLDAALAVDYSGVISRAIADSDGANANVIADARLAIESGRLDSPEAIASAAENILKLGI